MRSRLSANIYKRNMKGLVNDFYRRSNIVNPNFNMCDSQNTELFAFNVLFEPL